MAFLVGVQLPHRPDLAQCILQRAVDLEDSSNKFWITVDKRLEEIAKGKRTSSVKLVPSGSPHPFFECHTTDLNNRALNEIYNQDLTTYPPEDDALLPETRPTTAHSEMNRHIRSRS